MCFILFFLFVWHHQEGSDHEEGEDADGEEEDFDMAGEETSDESDSEELEEKGRIHLCKRIYFIWIIDDWICFETKLVVK